MTKDELKIEIKRLIDDAFIIAPTIKQNAGVKGHGKYDDKELNNQTAERWHAESSAIIFNLSKSELPAFQNLNGLYYNYQAKSQENHCKSIFVHQVQQLLISELELLDSRVSNDLVIISSERYLELTEKQAIAMAVPKKVTLSWLFQNVSLKIWSGSIAVILSTYLAGAYSTKLPIICEILGVFTNICIP